MSISDFFDSPQTFYGYDDMVTLGTIRVIFHNEKKSEEGTLIEFTGSACRKYLLKQIERGKILFMLALSLRKKTDNREIEDVWLLPCRYCS